MVAAINDDVREIVAELDADGGGYRTSEASRMLVHRYVAAGVSDAGGRPTPKVLQLMRMGASVAFHNYRADSTKHAKTRQRAAASASGLQSDFLEISEDFEFRWLMSYAAAEEGEDAGRKVLLRMTLPEVRAVIALKRKKAAEALAVAEQLQQIIDANPDWVDNPSMTVADVLGITE